MSISSRIFTINCLFLANLQYIFEQMDLNLLNFPINLIENQYNSGNQFLDNQKSAGHTTLQDNSVQSINFPTNIDGIFWNTNHCAIQKPINMNMDSLEKTFEEELAKKHLVVVKVALYSYFSNLSQGQNYCQTQNQMNNQFWDNNFNKKRNTRQAIDEFIKNLRDCKQFNGQELDSLEKILDRNPIYYKTFQIFSEGLSHNYKQKMFHLIFKSLQMISALEQNQNMIQYLFEFVDKKYSGLNISPWLKENQINFPKFAKIIIYSTIVYSLGKSFNKFYEQSLKKDEYKSMLTSKLWNYSKQPNLLTKIKNKKTVVIKRR